MVIAFACCTSAVYRCSSCLGFHQCCQNTPMMPFFEHLTMLMLLVCLLCLQCCIMHSDVLLRVPLAACMQMAATGGSSRQASQQACGRSQGHHRCGAVDVGNSSSEQFDSSSQLRTWRRLFLSLAEQARCVICQKQLQWHEHAWSVPGGACICWKLGHAEDITCVPEDITSDMQALFLPAGLVHACMCVCASLGLHESCLLMSAITRYCFLQHAIIMSCT